jgi:hypothetical protein
VEKSWGALFFSGTLKNFQVSLVSAGNVFLLKKHAIQAKMREPRQQLVCTDVSSNDVMTAAANKASDLFVLTENARGVQDASQCREELHLGNASVERSLFRPGDATSSAVLLHGSYSYKTNDPPVLPIMCVKIARMTSLASIAENFIYEGTQKCLHDAILNVHQGHNLGCCHHLSIQ